MTDSKKSPLAAIAMMVISGVVGGGVVLGAQALLQGGGDASGDVVRNYILENPEILPEAMQRLEAKQSGAAVGTHKAHIFTPYASAWQGNPKADVTVSVWMDYACGYCRASLPTIAKLLAEDPNVRIVYRELPVLSRESGVAAQWALAAADQGKFIPFHNALYGAGQLTEAALENAIKVSGIDRKAAQAALESSKVTGELAKNLSAARDLNISGTPSWVIGDQVLPGLIDYDTLKNAVATARKAKS